MTGIRSGHRLPLLKLAVPLGAIALWMFAGCAAKKADLPPPAPPPVQQTPTTAPSPSVPGRSPATQGGVPGGWTPSGSHTGKSPADLRSGPMLVHKVRYPGESVSIIAGWYTGDIENWKVLAEVNPGVNPNVIHEGMKINIPESMLKTREPMSKEYVDGFYPKSRSRSKGTGSHQSPKPADEETPLFGPKH